MTRPSLTGADRAVKVSAGLLLVEVCLIALTLAVRTKVVVVERIDSTIATNLNSLVRHHPAVVTSWKMVSVVGGPRVWETLGLVVALVLWTRRRRRWAAMITVGLAGAEILSSLIKVLIGRSRPHLVDAVAHAGGKSFPSGHALTSFVAVGLIVVIVGPRLTGSRRTWLVVAGVGVVVLVGLSRLVLGVHYLSDVIASWLIGTLLLASVVIVGRTGR